MQVSACQLPLRLIKLAQRYIADALNLSCESSAVIATISVAAFANIDSSQLEHDTPVPKDVPGVRLFRTAWASRLAWYVLPHNTDSTSGNRDLRNSNGARG